MEKVTIPILIIWNNIDHFYMWIWTSIDMASNHNESVACDFNPINCCVFVYTICLYLSMARPPFAYHVHRTRIDVSILIDWHVCVCVRAWASVWVLEKEREMDKESEWTSEQANERLSWDVAIMCMLLWCDIIYCFLILFIIPFDWK